MRSIKRGIQCFGTVAPILLDLRVIGNYNLISTRFNRIYIKCQQHNVYIYSYFSLLIKKGNCVVLTFSSSKTISMLWVSAGEFFTGTFQRLITRTLNFQSILPATTSVTRAYLVAILIEAEIWKQIEVCIILNSNKIQANRCMIFLKW